ncbi:MAG: ATP-binding protein [Pseudomonadota bacterium]|nr:ATP-binding protein [Pseudomonadota bacterium]
MKSWKIIDRVVFLAILPVSLLALSVTVYYAVHALGDLEEDMRERGGETARLTAVAAAKAIRDADFDQLLEVASSTLQRANVAAVSITSLDGETLVELAQSGAQTPIGPSGPMTRLIEAVFGTGTIMFREPIPRDPKTQPRPDAIPAGTVGVTLSTALLNDARVEVITRAILVALLILGTATLACFAVARAVSRPLGRVLATLEPEGGQSTDRHLKTGEIAALERGIDDMSQRIDASREKQSRAVGMATARLQRRIDEIDRRNEELVIARIQSDQASLSKSRLLANMSHELRTPMNAIIGFADLLGDYRIDDAHTEYVATIRRSASELLVLINEVLDYSRIESGELQVSETRFNIYELIEGIVSLLKKTAQEKRLDLLVYIDPAIPLEIRSDPQRIRQALINLFGNAIKFTREGHVALELQSRHDGGAHTGGTLEFRIIDTGCGIEEGDIDKVFKPFQQVDDSLTRQHGGTGLGLSISRHFIEKLGGEIGFDSTPGAGSTFWFTVPFDAQAGRGYTGSFPLRGKRALIFDRNPTRADYTQRLLKAWGLEVRRTESVEAFLTEYASPDTAFILYYMIRSDVDTDLQISFSRLADAPAATFFLHDVTYRRDLSSSSGFTHINNLISPHRLHAMLVERSTGTAPAEDRSTGETGEAAREEDLNGARVLVADDNEINRRLLEVYISRNNGQVIQAVDGRDAVERASAEAPDVVIMDVHMPNLDGISAMRVIRETSPGIPAIALTADAVPDRMQQCLRSGFDRCLTKPVPEQELIATTLRLLKGKTSGRPARASGATEIRADEAVPVLDSEKAVRLAGGNRDLARELFGMLKIDLKSRLPMLNDENPDTVALGEMAHKVRGGAKYCAAEVLQTRAGELEAAVDRGESGPALESRISGLRESIEVLLRLDDPY